MNPSQIAGRASAPETDNKLVHALVRACAIIIGERQVLVDSYTEAGGGQVAADAKDDLERFDEVLKAADEALAAHQAASGLAPDAEVAPTVDAAMSAAMVFASAWSLVGGRFDDGGGLEAAELRAVVEQLAAYPHPVVPALTNAQRCSLKRAASLLRSHVDTHPGDTIDADRIDAMLAAHPVTGGVPALTQEQRDSIQRAIDALPFAHHIIPRLTELLAAPPARAEAPEPGRCAQGDNCRMCGHPCALYSAATPARPSDAREPLTSAQIDAIAGKHSVWFSVDQGRAVRLVVLGRTHAPQLEKGTLL